jgi:hypothetical protein
MKNPAMHITARLVCLAFLLTLLALMRAAAQGPTALPADKTAKIEAAISALMSRQNIPCLTEEAKAK